VTVIEIGFGEKRMLRRARPALRSAAAVTGTGLMLLSVALLPGAAAAETRDLIVNGTFASGAGHLPWWVTPNLSLSTTSQELCVTVPAGGNLWDSIAGQKNITLDGQIEYTLSFDARATSAVTIRTQLRPMVNPNSLTYLVQDLSVGTTDQSYSYTFTPAVGSGSVDTELQFRLGGNPSGYTICLDDIALTGEYPDVVDPDLGTDELLVNGTFDTGSKPWWSNAGMAMDTSGQNLCLAVTASALAWDRLVGQNSLHLKDQTKYELSFDAYASTTVQIGANIAPFDNPGNVSYLGKTLSVTSTPKHFRYPFTTSLGTDHVRSQLQLRLGGAADGYSICFDNISLQGTAYSHVPDTGPAVKVNQVGYLTHGPKNATVVSADANPVPWVLMQGIDEVAQGLTTPAGIDGSADVNVHTIDFTHVDTIGTGFTLQVDGQQSHPFTIGDDVYGSLRTDALKFFYANRSGIAIDGAIAGAEYARPAGHVGVAPNQGDTVVGCQDPQSFTDGWTCGYTLDVSGGWYDAGDHGKYVVNGGIATYQLLSTWERAVAAGTQAALGDSTLAVPERGNGVPDILDEARWQLDFMLKMQVPDGDPLAGMVHHKVADATWTGLPLLPDQDAKRRILHRPSTAATLNLAAVAAQGARLFDSYDPVFAARLLAAAERAYAAAVQHPGLFAPSADGDGSGTYSDSDVTDEFYWAAAELYITTGDDAFEQAVLGDPLHTDSGVLGTNGFFWGGVAALGRLDLARFAPQLPGIAEVRASVVAAATTLLSLQDGEAFGQVYAPGAGAYVWGSNASILNNQVVLATAFDLNQDPRFARAVVESYDYLLGRNVLGMSYVTGYGEQYAKNQHSRWYARSLKSTLPNPPVGSVAGGPNSSIQDPIAKTWLAGCAPQWCYVDDIEAWSVNEITVNWNSALTWVASFVADQGAGESTVVAAVHVTSSPGDATVTDGQDVQLYATATGSPAPGVQWQTSTDGVTWVDVDGATGTTLTLTSMAHADSGLQVRAVFSNGVGAPVATAAATVTVLPAEVTPPTSGAPTSSAAPAPSVSSTPASPLPTATTASPGPATPAPTTSTPSVNPTTSTPSVTPTATTTAPAPTTSPPGTVPITLRPTTPGSTTEPISSGPAPTTDPVGAPAVGRTPATQGAVQAQFPADKVAMPADEADPAEPVTSDGPPAAASATDDGGGPRTRWVVVAGVAALSAGAVVAVLTFVPGGFSAPGREAMLRMLRELVTRGFAR
jgi:endoglucanase